MPRVFQPNESRRYTGLCLDERSYWLLVSAGLPVIAPAAGCGPPADGALLLCTERAREDARASWAVLCGKDAELYVNGELVRIGFRVLRHKDELRLGRGAAVYFSTEETARVASYARDDAPRCPRCAQAIEKGDRSVRCPGCGVVFHELEERRCWTYAETCALCDQPTALDAALRWSPEDL